jgi:hypothetical protein
MRKLVHVRCANIVVEKLLRFSGFEFRIFSIHFDDDLDGSEGGVGELGEAGGDVVEGEAVGNPEVGVDLSGGTAWMA